MHCVRRTAENSTPSKSVSCLFSSFKGFLSTKKAFRGSNPTPLPSFKRWFNRQWAHLLTAFWYAFHHYFSTYLRSYYRMFWSLKSALNWTSYGVITENGFYGNQKDENNIKRQYKEGWYWIQRQKTLINERDMKYDRRKESFEKFEVRDD